MSPPSAIAHYRIISKLGEGGMGAVYRATDTKLNRDVAIKVLPDAVADHPDRLARFAREAKMLAALNHPNIAAIYGVEDRALVLELVEGHAPGGPMPLAAALPLIQQLIDALEYAHERGVVHRDLKPSNLRVTPDGALKLLDFGLAKAIESAPAPSANLEDSPTLTMAATVAGQILGTAAYMAPEQARGGKVDHRADIWAFGVVVYELLTGRSAFTGATVTEILASVLKTDPDLNPLPQPARRLVERCLCRDLRHRLGWIGEARQLLAEPVPAPSTGRRSKGIAAAAIVAAAVLGAVGGARWLPAGGSGAPEPAQPVRRITTDSAVTAPALSPDGKMVAYVAIHGAKRDLMVQRVGSPAAIRLAGVTIMASLLAFSADGSRIYYADPGPPAGIYEVPVFGGEPRLVIANAVNASPSPDGKWLGFVRERELYVQPAAGGAARRVGPVAGYAFNAGFVWSPDSSRLLYIKPFNNDVNNGALQIVPADGGDPRPGPGLYANLVRRGFGNLNVMSLLAWRPNGDLIFSARHGDATNLFRIPLASAGDAAPAPVTAGPWDNGRADVHGSFLIFVNGRETNQVWRLPADVNAGKVRGPLERVTPDLVEAQFPDVLPDGSTLAYVSRKDGGQGVFYRDLRTGRERVVAMAEQNSAYSTFSPDGSRIAFGRGGAAWPSFTVSTAGGEVKALGNAGGRIRGWSRDGKYLLIWKGVGTMNGISVLDVATGAVTEIAQGSRRPYAVRFSPDSRWIAFNTVDLPGKSPLWVAPFHGAAPIPESEWIAVADRGILPFWSPDGRWFHYATSSGPNSTDGIFHRQPFNPTTGRLGGPPVQFFSTEGRALGAPLLNTTTATRDHIYLLLTTGQSDIWMMDLPR